MQIENKWYNQKEVKVEDYLNEGDIFLAKCINHVNDVYVRLAKRVSYGSGIELSIGLSGWKLLEWCPVVRPSGEFKL